MQTYVKTFLQWVGPAWYAPRQEGGPGNVHITFYRVVTNAFSDDYSTASDDAFRQGLGTPEWFNTRDEAERVAFDVIDQSRLRRNRPAQTWPGAPRPRHIHQRRGK